MTEGQLRKAIARLLPKTVHRQSMTSASLTHNGTPDDFFDGPDGDLWVEYKQLRAMPRSGIAIGAYSALQIAWMERRWRNGAGRECQLEHPLRGWVDVRPMIGIVGLPTRTVCLQLTPDEWQQGTPVTDAITYQEAAHWISDFCGG